VAVGIGLLVAHPLSRAQPVATVRRVGFLGISSMAAGRYVIEAFKQGMRDFGWLEGKNVEYRFVFASGDMTRLDGLVLELLSQQVEVLVLSTPQAARAAQRATKTIPVVMAYGSNAVGNGLVASLARPAGNITGISNQNEEVLGKLIEILHEITPGTRRVAIVLNETNPSHDYYGPGWATTAVGRDDLFTAAPARNPSAVK
jgi:putative ABC transport system substrate-binding protein